MNQEKIGKFIAVLRKQKGLTQSELGEKIGITSKAVSKWERGVCMPDVTKLNIVANVLNISVTELLNGESEQGANKVNEFAKNSTNYYGNLFSKKTIERNIIILLIIFTFIFIVFTLFEINNFRKILVYDISPMSNGYFIDDNFIKTNKSQILTLIDITTLNRLNSIKKEYLFEFLIFTNDTLTEHRNVVLLYKHDNFLVPLMGNIKPISIYVIDDLNQMITFSKTLNEKNKNFEIN